MLFYCQFSYSVHSASLKMENLLSRWQSAVVYGTGRTVIYIEQKEGGFGDEKTEDICR